jgi:arginine:ornithine antiporter/lysine permease
LYAPGTWLYVYARREQQQRVFTAAERPVFALFCTAAMAALIALWAGAITI